MKCATLLLLFLLVAVPAFAQTNNKGIDTAFTVGVTSTPLFSANSQRGHVFVQNTGNFCVFCAFGTLNNCNIFNGRMLLPGAYFEYDSPVTPQADLCCISTGGITNVVAYQTTTKPPQ